MFHSRGRGWVGRSSTILADRAKFRHSLISFAIERFGYAARGVHPSRGALCRSCFRPHTRGAIRAIAHRRSGIKSVRRTTARAVLWSDDCEATSQTGRKAHVDPVTPQFSRHRRFVRARRRHERSGTCRDAAGRQVRSCDQGRRCARSEPVAARPARYRHPLWRDRGGGSRDSGGARAARARCRRQAGHAGIGRPPRARVPVRVGDRHSRRRARALPMHHHLRLGGGCRRE